MSQFAEAYSDYKNQELKNLIEELFRYYPNITGYDDIRKELLKRLK